MAKIFYVLKQNNNSDAKVYGKWFAHGKTTETDISSREFIKRAEFVNAEAFAEELKKFARLCRLAPPAAWAITCS